ncbi:hypothetical protein EUGRSUZ_G02540 [Eucalyptus grandis]|uniref:Uncharacterized protein n=2 Tax=Eucalyptus grandis TaxID=71139 RepID=A0ACC3K7N8_EUCGR|nr:hypothetical protein EUGRSUZ_G02540 [Eucalyptus grandis]
MKEGSSMICQNGIIILLLKRVAGHQLKLIWWQLSDQSHDMTIICSNSYICMNTVLFYLQKPLVYKYKVTTKTH